MSLNTNLGLGSLDNQFATFESLKANGTNNIAFLKKHLNNPDYTKPQKTFILSEIERLTDIPRSSIRDREKSNQLVYHPSADNPKRSYSLEDIKVIRKSFNKGYFNGAVDRPKSELHPLTLAFGMFKGGVGKTTQATHLAAHCAINGLKVLLVDLDPQASSTFVFSYIPSVDIQTGDTIFTSLIEDPSSITRVIKPTHYHGLEIITSGLELQSADIMLPNANFNNADKLGPPLLRLYQSLDNVKENYDLIILDCAPNHGPTTMNALTAADGIILPVTPNMLSYGSSIQFVQTLHELSATLISYRNEILKNNDPFNLKPYLDNFTNKLFRVLITNDPADKEAQDVTDAIRNLYGSFVLPRPMSRTIALARAANDMSLIYDLKRQEVRGAKESYDRGLACMKAVNDDILTLISSIWDINNDR